MVYLYKLSFLLYIAAQLVIDGHITYAEVIIILLLAASNIFRQKFKDSKWLLLSESIIIIYASTIDKHFTMLFAYIVFDAIYEKTYYNMAIALIPSLFLLKADALSQFFLVTIISGIFGYILRKYNEDKKEFQSIFDNERRTRYELEEARVKLLNSASDVALLAETKERNRIATEIHDNVGHSIAGVLMQLQAANRLRGRDDEKSNELLLKSIDHLSDSLNMLRNTVHNIKPAESLGVEYIKKIIDNFSFCPVEFKCTGDFNVLPANYMEIISSCIKETLTNASKHSNATQMLISIDITPKYIRLYIKDNGSGCLKIKEGLGLSGIKERVRNTGGNVSISSDNGFMIVCIIPLDTRERGDIFESADSR